MNDINKNRLSGQLFIIATPIGHRNDITLRALEILKQVDLIACEDTRHSRTLLNYFQIDTPVTSYHEFNERSKTSRLIQSLQQGQHIALICDAGTPLISDPGTTLLQQAWHHHIKIHPIPGPCAAIGALSVTTLPTHPFLFEGFLPAKTTQRSKRLRQLINHEATLVFYEAPHRVQDSLADMADILGHDRRAMVARELTKRYEQVVHHELTQLHQLMQQGDIKAQGEFVILVQGHSQSEQLSDSVTLTTKTLLQQLLQQLSLKQAVQIAARLTGQRKNQLYQYALTLQHHSDM